MDAQVSCLSPFGLAKALPLGDVRPRWAAMQAWWDLDCDRDLLVGSFLHGFGAYPKMRMDPRLCFASKVGILGRREETLRCSMLYVQYLLHCSRDISCCSCYTSCSSCDGYRVAVVIDIDNSRAMSCSSRDILCSH